MGRWPAPTARFFGVWMLIRIWRSQQFFQPPRPLVCNLTRVISMKAPVSKSWKSLLENHDDASLWQSLHRLVSVHPLVRSAQRSMHGPTHPTPLFSLNDLTQDLY